MVLPENYAVPVRVRNTFIDTSVERSPSLERFYREREVSTCPSAHIGRLKSLLQEWDVSNEEVPQWSPAPDMSSGVASALLEAQCEGEGAAAGGPAAPPILVLSLAEALCPSSQPWQPYAFVGQESQASGFADAAACAFEVPSDVVCNAQQFSWNEVAPAHDLSAYGYLTEEHHAHMNTSLGTVNAQTSPGMFFPSVSAEIKVVPAPPDRPAPGSAELPSTGSAGHAEGRCKPCAFYTTVGCNSGLACQFCHLCEAGEKKRRRKEKLDARRAEQRGRQARRQASGAEGIGGRVGAGSE